MSQFKKGDRIICIASDEFEGFTGKVVAVRKTYCDVNIDDPKKILKAYDRNKKGQIPIELGHEEIRLLTPLEQLL